MIIDNQRNDIFKSAELKRRTYRCMLIIKEVTNDYSNKNFQHFCCHPIYRLFDFKNKITPKLVLSKTVEVSVDQKVPLFWYCGYFAGSKGTQNSKFQNNY